MSEEIEGRNEYIAGRIVMVWCIDTEEVGDLTDDQLIEEIKKHMDKKESRAKNLEISVGEVIIDTQFL